MKKIILISIMTLAVAFGAYFLWGRQGGQTAAHDLSVSTTTASRGDASPSDIGLMPPVSADSLTQTYTDSTYGFTFKYPKGYTATSVPNQDSSGATILVQSAEQGGASSPSGFEIIISPFGEEMSVLTVDRIKQDLPDMTINSPQDVVLGDGPSAGKGVAFLSDSPDFNGNSRNVWFIYKKNLYQITTYALDDPLLQAVLNTWQFK